MGLIFGVDLIYYEACHNDKRSKADATRALEEDNGAHEQGEVVARESQNLLQGPARCLGAEST